VLPYAASRATTTMVASMMSDAAIAEARDRRQAPAERPAHEACHRHAFTWPRWATLPRIAS